MTYDHLMTNEEAIEELKKVDTLDMPVRLCEAYYMSIKALEFRDKVVSYAKRLVKKSERHYYGYVKIGDILIADQCECENCIHEEMCKWKEERHGQECAYMEPQESEG